MRTSMRNARQRNLLASLLALLLCVALAAPPAAAANVSEPTETSTSEIFSTTVEGMNSCFRWRIKGICIWLVCTIYECHVEETVRIQHYTPDVTISVWHDPETHPWQDYGRKVAKQTSGAGNWLIGQFAGSALGPLLKQDSAGTKTKGDRDTRNFLYRGADAIGNPVNFISGALTGNFGTSGSGPTSVAVPLPYELAQWFGSFGSQVMEQWASVPSTYTSGQTGFAQQQTTASSSQMGLSGGNSSGVGSTVVGLYNSAMGSYSQNGKLDLGASGDGGSQGGGADTGNGGGNSGGTGGQGGNSGNSGNSNGGSGGGSSDSGSGDGGGSEFMCPTGIMPFGLAFHSELDAPFWRGLLPLENIYPATWLPGMREVGQGVLQTWGNVWPRQGTLFQQHPVKGAAVFAQRVGDIISYHAQPHIYSALQLDSDPNYQFFGFQGIREHDEEHTIWQRVFPNPQTTCAIFGENDSLALNGFGDGQNMNHRGTVWNAWRRQDCCVKASGGAVAFITSIPFD